MTVILPVYDAFALLGTCLERLSRNSDLPWRAVVIDDASPDARVGPLLREFAARHPAGQVVVLENPANLGFIGTVNRALEVAEGMGTGPVVLLNSDAMVPPGWLSRLLAPMLADPTRVASVTPMSNDADLLSVPVIGTAMPLAEGEGEAIDRVAHGLAERAAQVDLPTGVGFCMAMNRRFLARVPRLDTVFGRGYGEEVDWCRRTAAHGGRHLAQPRLFVEHRGAGSFGSAQKQALLRANGAILSARYPSFDAEVQAFLGRDPLLTQRLALGLGLAAARAKGEAVPIWLGHSLGGGAEIALGREVAAAVAGQGAGVVLRVGGSRRWRVELHTAAGTVSGDSDDAAFVTRLLGLLPRRRVVYSCGVGDSDPLGLPGFLLSLVRGEGQRLEIRLHDYFPISPSPTLMGRDGRYAGVPDPATRDPAHAATRPDGSRADLALWRREWQRLADRADEVTAFSAASAAIARSVWPFLGERLRIRPHALPVPVARVVPPAPGAPPVIGVLGNIGAHKGAALVLGLAARLRAGRRARLVVLGEMDPAFRLPRGVRVHGSYRPEEIGALVRRYGITCWLVPSIWPETFSFTTHEALATGLPVWCLDLGAQAEAVRAAVAQGAGGGVIPLRAGAVSDADAVLAAILGGAPAGGGRA